ncbi:MAG TPA: PKD domain-containing protein [Solimonas sp.]|nr:PKD domain-containing protein [Solimonas sp.]
MRHLSKALATLALACCAPLHAAEPAEGTISPANPTTTFDSGPYLTASGPGCGFQGPCDSYTVTVELPPDFFTTDPNAYIRFGLGWDLKGDLYSFTLTDGEGNDVTAESTASNDLGSNTIYIPASVGTGTFTLRLDIAALTVGNSVIHGVVSLVTGTGEGLRPNPVGPGTPRYQTYEAPEGLSGNTGEPSVGYNIASKQAFILSGLKTLWSVFPQDLDPALPQACEAEWAERSHPVTSATSLDPIGITDSLVRGHETNRTFIGQLVGVNSASAYTDDDGATYVPMQGGPPLSSTDHQTFAAGPYPASHPLGIVPNPIYPNAVYYCGQDVAFASCARSDDGGLTFGPPAVIYSINDCAGLHGHARVGPDGTVYVPSKACGTSVAVNVSEDAGVTWSNRKVPNTVPAIRDPQIALATDGSGYLCFVDGDRNPAVAVTRDHGLTWTGPTALGLEMGIKHAMFTQAIAGDPDRATCAFLATTTEGNPVAADFPGVWHLYFSTTYDGGATWTTVNATPEDPIQGVGGIWNVGGGPPNRNLLDFNEMSIDERGYPMYGYADGCIGTCNQDPSYNTFAAMPRITRQIAGKPLYAEFETPEPRAPAAACLAGVRTPERTQLTWRKPENGGAQIAQYKVFRGLAAGAETLVGSTDGTPGYIDLTADPAVEHYFYKVTAVNAQGEGVASNTIDLPITIPEDDSVCAVPGKRLITDATGDSRDASVDLVSLHVSEPPDAPDTLIFQIKVASLATPPPGTMYAALFHTPAQPMSNPNDSFVGMVVEAAGPVFVYGHRVESVIGVAVVQEYFVDGTLDPASAYSDDGTISLVVPRSLFGLVDGDRIGALSMNSHTGATSTGEHIVRSTNTLDAAETGEPYLLRTADACLPNTAPIARLVATPSSGAAPLEVVLDASSSSDAEDAIVEYVFDPGDQSAQVTQSSPRLTHRYTTKGFWRATVQVRDARGKLGQSVAQAVIDTTGAAAAPVGAATPSTDLGRFGGALGGLPLVLLAAGAALRRRRR